MILTLTTPTLERLGFINAAIWLWKCKLNRHPFTDWPKLSDRTEWTDIEKEICIEVDALPLPKSTKRTLGNEFLHHIGQELHNWISTLGEILSSFDRAKLKLVVEQTKWTPHGKIDKKESITSLSKCNELSLNVRFNLACFFFVEESVREIWPQIRNEVETTRCVEYWLDVLSEPNYRRYSSLLSKFAHYSFPQTWRHLTVIRYFFDLRAEEDKYRFLIEALGRIVLSDLPSEIVFFLLSQMTEKQLQFVLDNHRLALAVLFSAAKDWVYCEFLIDIYNRVHRFLDERSFYYLLIEIAEREMHCDDFKSYFTSVWCKGLTTWKKLIFSNVVRRQNLMRLLHAAEDDKNIRLCLDELGVEESSPSFFLYFKKM